MGIELLDITFRLEKRFRVKILNGDLEALFRRHDPPDPHVADLVDLIRSKFVPPGVDDGGAIAADLWCVGCGYNLRGLPPGHRCPECGVSTTYDDQVWHGVRETLRDVLNVRRREIRAEAGLERDLGMS